MGYLEDVTAQDRFAPAGDVASSRQHRAACRMRGLPEERCDRLGVQDHHDGREKPDMWCLISDVDGSRLGEPTTLDRAKVAYAKWVAEHPHNVADVFIEELGTGEQLAWNPHTHTWDAL